MLKILIVPLWAVTLVALACMKKTVSENDHPPMQYTQLNNLELSAQDSYHLDIDANGQPDFTFHTQLVGDPLLQQDRRQFLVGSKIQTSLLNDDGDQSPRLNKGDRISLYHPGHTWYNVSSILLAEKVMWLDGSITWQGRWKGAAHHYLPVQVEKSGKTYLGWVEISFDTTRQKLTLHKAALSTESGRDIRAGF